MADFKSLEAIIEWMRAEMKGHEEKMMAILKANLKEMKSVAEYQEVPKEEATGNFWSTEELIWGTASSHRAPSTAEEMDPGRWWVPAEVGRCLQRDDSLHSSCTMQSAKTRQGQCSTRTPKGWAYVKWCWEILRGNNGIRGRSIRQEPCLGSRDPL
jgi:hypothetical protein